MSIYQKLAKVGSRFFSPSTLFKYGFNLSPMYRRSTGRITSVSNDIYHVQVKLPITWKNRNYMNTIFGGSMFSSVDPIPMIQLVNILGNDYIIWDKSAEVLFKKPANEDLHVDFNYSKKEIESIKKRLVDENEIQIEKTSKLTNKDKTIVFCEVKKVIYIANKSFYKEKLQKRKKNRKPS